VRNGFGQSEEVTAKPLLNGCDERNMNMFSGKKEALRSSLSEEEDGLSTMRVALHRGAPC
jgi:hypothetical protein